MTDREDGARPWAEVTTPPSVRIARWLAIAIAIAIAVSAVGGALTAEGAARRLVRALFFASSSAYLTVSLVDFWEHFRLEKRVTGRYLSATVIPVGETLNHAATVLVIALFLLLARPPAPLALRDLFCLAAPGLFLTLGWRDELVYHRRRSSHREDILHTVAHLAAAALLASFVTMRMVTW